MGALTDSYLEDESVNLKGGALAARKGLEVNAFRNRLIEGKGSPSIFKKTVRYSMMARLVAYFRPSNRLGLSALKISSSSHSFRLNGSMFANVRKN